MPSPPHEVTIELFRNQPRLARQLLSEVLHVELPDCGEARLDSADLPQLQPTEYRADAVITLTNREDSRPTAGVIVEVQMDTHQRKRYTWPVYVANLRARLQCPVFLLVVTHDESVARWSARPIDMGCGKIVPQVIGPREVPAITNVRKAKRNPELAVLSAMAHGRDCDFSKAVRIASAAQQAVIGLDDDPAILYLDVILSSLSDAARLELRTMKPAGYQFQSEFIRTHFFKARQEGLTQGHAAGLVKGRAEGRAEGQASLIIRQLTVRFGRVRDEERTLVSRMSAAELDDVGERLLTASTLQDALAPR